MTSPELVFDAVAATGILFATETGATEGCRVLLWGATFGSHCDASGVHLPGVSCSLCDLRSWATSSSHQWRGECRCSEPWFRRRCRWPYWQSCNERFCLFKHQQALKPMPFHRDSIEGPLAADTSAHYPCFPCPLCMCALSMCVWKPEVDFRCCSSGAVDLCCYLTCFLKIH